MNALKTYLKIFLYVLGGGAAFLLCAFAGLYLLLWAMFTTDGVAHGDEVEWNGGTVRIVDYSGFPSSHMNYIELHRDDERVEQLFKLGDHSPNLAVNEYGRLRVTIWLGSRMPFDEEREPAEGEQVEWSGGMAMVLDRGVPSRANYCVEWHRDGNREKELFDFGDHKPELHVDAYGDLTVVVDIWGPKPKVAAAEKEESRRSSEPAA